MPGRRRNLVETLHATSLHARMAIFEWMIPGVWVETLHATSLRVRMAIFEWMIPGVWAETLHATSLHAISNRNPLLIFEKFIIIPGAYIIIDVGLDALVGRQILYDIVIVTFLPVKIRMD